MPNFTAVDGLLVGQPRRVAAPRPTWRRETIFAARWRVHAAGPAHSIGATLLAGAEVDCFLNDAEEAMQNPPGGRFLLTFWREAGEAPGSPRAVLASFASREAIGLTEQETAAPAEFHFAIHRTHASVDVVGERAILRATHRDGASPRVGAAAYCQSILPELLGLRGGQYRLDEVRLERAAAARFAAPDATAREAV